MTRDYNPSNPGETPLVMVPYTGGGYNYYCEAVPGVAKTASAWKITRVLQATGQVDYAGSGTFIHPATDYATVAALTFNQGVSL